MKKSAKRFLTAIPLGILAGVLCAYLASSKQPELFSLISPLFWVIVSDRFVLGIMVALAGAYVRHPVFGFRCYAWLRGAVMGALASLPLATGVFLMPAAGDMTSWTVFWLTVGVGAVYGLIIDVIATKIGGEGKDLLA